MDSKTYWRSLAERAGDPAIAEALEREFVGETPDEFGDDSDGTSRRRFLQIMGASFAMAGLAGCRWPKETILPFSKNPPGTVPGAPKHYATAMDLGGVAQPLVVTSYDGRPIKIEGNDAHPLSQGAAKTYAQASVLELYDPDRSRGVLRKDGGAQQAASWDDFVAYAQGVVGSAKQRGGAGLRVLSEASSSPSLQAMRDKLLAALPQARWHEYESLSRDNEREGTRLAFGRPHRALLNLERADVLACLDADLLGDHPNSVGHSKAFAKRRRPGPDMSRIYAVEARYSITGAQADHRLPVRAEQVLPLLYALESEIAGEAARAEGFLGEEKVRKFLKALAKDLAASRGAALVAVGPAQPPEAHAAAARINAALGAVGQTVSYAAEPDAERPTHVEDLKALTADMKSGSVSALFILGGNPVYDAPADLAFGEALAKVAETAHLSAYNDETSRACKWHVNRAHYLEAWGDARAYDGVYSVVQPLIDPLFGGRSAIETIAAALGAAPQKGYDIVRETFRRFARGSYEASWRRALHDGLVEGTGFPAERPTAAPRTGTQVPARALGPAENGALELIFVQDSKVYDGRFANSAWLQELPDFMTKLTWDNAALVSPATAEKLGVRHGDLARLTLGGRTLEAAVYLMPGQAAGSVALALGYGRKAAGKVGGFFPEGVATTGFDAGALRASDAPWIASGLKVEPTGRTYVLATTQDHHLVDAIGQKGRDERMGQLIREADLEHYEHHPDFAQHVVHHPELVSLWKEHEYDGYRWAMAIDLNLCTGCNACVTACQSENNIPVVGKAQVLKNREMHWIRIDRYFKGDVEDPQIAHQPVTCHQCELAPCEQVCPVAATVHSDEGLNDMVYNRCIGTRYCSNNCPYKVRRFNFFNYQKSIERQPRNDVLRMVFNPEVTVRYRGVMEKCTFCVQRIQNAKIPAKNEGRKVRDGEIVTACQQTCPSDAIVFGDLSDPESRVSKLHADSRTYAMLEELNVKPRLKYMAKVRNPNPELA